MSKMPKNISGLKRGNPATQFKKGEQQRKIASAGGKASAAAKKRRKLFNEVVVQIANMQVPFDEAREIMRQHGIKESDRDYITLTTLRSAMEASRGDATQAQFFVNSYVKAMEQAEEAANRKFSIPADLLGKDFIDINREIKPNFSYVFKGGRGSLKSTFISEKVVELLINNPKMHACCVRKVGKTLKDSVWAQIKWSIEMMGLADDFECKKSPLEIVYKRTGQVIYFRGADDPGKIKSLKPPFGYIGILWIEERDQLNGPNEERNIKQSLLRGGTNTYDFASYNPPKSKSSWVNEIELEPNDKVIYHESNYLNVPKEWLGQRFLEDAETLKANNRSAFDNEYMGIANGSGGNVFDNVEKATITDEQIAGFKARYFGVDWGSYPDPYHFLACGFDKATGTIYIYDEHRCLKTPNADTGAWILQNHKDALKDAAYGVVCDSAEGKSIIDYQLMGIPALPCKKGAGSVDFGIKWLQWHKIVVDPVRCPHTYRELTQYEYPRDKDGNIVGGYKDADNHAIDALRYAFCLLYMTELPANGKYYQDNDRYSS